MVVEIIKKYSTYNSIACTLYKSIYYSKTVAMIPTLFELCNITSHNAINTYKTTATPSVTQTLGAIAPLHCDKHHIKTMHIWMVNL